MPIHYDKSDHIVRITIDRYEKRNAIDLDHGHALARAWQEFNEDDDAWVAIVTGVKDTFCVGGDLNMLNTLVEKGRASGNRNEWTAVKDESGVRWTLKGYDIYKPIVAAVNGFCMAGGFEMLGATDIRIASTTAVFQIPEPKRGLMAMGGTTARLPRQLSWVHAMELLLVAERVDAQRALELGLVNEVVEPEQLEDAALRWARRITANAPLAVQATKRSALTGFQKTLRDAFAAEEEIGADNMMNEDAAEGSRAFLEKRAPVWRGQ
jgi:enoyl-CoA hydratase